MARHKQIRIIVEEYFAIKGEEPNDDNIGLLIERTSQNTEDFLTLHADLLKKRAKNRGDLEQLAKVAEGAADLVASLAEWFRPLGQEKTEVLDVLVRKLRKLPR